MLCQQHPDWLFIFGDNAVERRGMGGQAVVRYEPNSHGIATKKHPNNNPGSFFTDNEFEYNIAIIKNDIDSIPCQKYSVIVLPEAWVRVPVYVEASVIPATLASTFMIASWLSPHLSSNMTSWLDPGTALPDQLAAVFQSDSCPEVPFTYVNLY